MFVVFGGTNVDLFIGGVDQLPNLGREEFAVDNLAWCTEPLRMVIGGNGANSAYILGKLGADVRLASAIGQDLLGNVVYGWLKNAGFLYGLAQGLGAASALVLGNDVAAQVVSSKEGLLGYGGLISG